MNLSKVRKYINKISKNKKISKGEYVDIYYIILKKKNRLFELRIEIIKDKNELKELTLNIYSEDPFIFKNNVARRIVDFYKVEIKNPQLEDLINITNYIVPK